MIIKKCIGKETLKSRYEKKPKERKPFVRKQEQMLMLNCLIRDAIFPFEYVLVEYDQNLNKVTLTPTNNAEEGYKVTLAQTRTSVQASICWVASDNVAHIKNKTKIFAQINDNGTITFELPELTLARKGCDDGRKKNVCKNYN